MDVNVLVAATMTAARDHDPARDWLQGRLRGTARVGLPWASITGFVRVVAQPRAWERPMPVDAALAVARSWLSRPCAGSLSLDRGISRSSTAFSAPSRPCVW